ncbi:MAG: hypothetical protein U9Q79_01660 [Candidatus Hydrogenedentes bacterium]|nr:hypothetical protein [Candidatus Hydrogenedentota bacterium]
MNKRVWSCVFAVLALVGTSEAAEQMIGKRLYTQNVSEMPELPAPLPSSVAASFDRSQSSDGNGSVRIDYEGVEPRSIVLYEVPNPGAENCTIWCEASLRGEGLKNIAYLEMWADFGEKGQYFSRGLDQVLTGDVDWREVRIPFFLKVSERPERFLIGVRMEGPGTVWIDDITLTRNGVVASAGGALQVAVFGALLGIFGGVCGLWGALAGFLAPRGRARAFVVAMGRLLTATGFVLLIVGVILTGTGAKLGWPCVLAGVIITVVLTPLNFVVRRAYQQAEMRRLAAHDLQ